VCFAFQIARRCVVLQISLLCPSVFAGARAISDQRQPEDLFRWFSLFCTTPSHVQTTKKPFIYRAVVYLSLSLFLLLFRRLLSSSFVGVRKPRGLSRLLHLPLGFRHVSIHVSRHLNTGPYAGTLHGISRADGVGDTVRGCFNGSENRHGTCAVGVVMCEDVYA